MNPDNYATFEASKRLHDAGIVLETERYWSWDECITTDPQLVSKISSSHWDRSISAPSMAEVWRELPQKYRFTIWKEGDYTWIDVPAELYEPTKEYGPSYFGNTNPTDALIDLLIWVTKQKRKERG